MASFAFDCSTFAFDLATQRQKAKRQKWRTFSLPAKVKVAQPLLAGLILYGLPADALGDFYLCLLPLRCLLPLCLGRTFSLPAKVKVAQPLLAGLILYGLPAVALRAKVALPFAFWALCPVAKSKG